jgi:hypothetical protein
MTASETVFMTPDEIHEPTHVVFIDFEGFVDLYTPISITDVLRILAFTLDREATAEEAIRAGKDPDALSVGYLRQWSSPMAWRSSPTSARRTG